MEKFAEMGGIVDSVTSVYHCHSCESMHFDVKLAAAAATTTTTTATATATATAPATATATASTGCCLLLPVLLSLLLLR